MNRIIKMFVYLSLLLILLEMSMIGLFFTKSFLYLIAICILTIGISLVGYGLYVFSSTSKHSHDEYHFYYIDTKNLYEDELYNKIRKRL